MLQVKEEKEHWLLSDERIRLFFVDPRYLSEPMGIIQKTKSRSAKISSGLQTPTPGKGAPTRHSRTSAGVTKASRPFSTVQKSIQQHTRSAATLDSHDL